MFEEPEYGEMSFAALEKAEAEKFTVALLDLDQRLCTAVQLSIKQPGDTIEIHDTFPKYYSEGYDANHEGVGDEEIVQWQRGALTFLRVEGTAIPLQTTPHTDTSASHGPDIALTNDQYYVEDLDMLPQVDENIQSLVVVGKSMTISNLAAPVPCKNNHTNTELATDEEEGEYIAQHGILQEYVDYSGVGCDAEDSGAIQSTASPSDSNRDEIVSSMMDAVWPGVVEAMKPLIYNVLRAAKENNIPYTVDQLQAVKSDCEFEDGEFGGDDFW